MIHELSSAGAQLRSALDRYARACSKAREVCLSGGRLNSNTELITGLKKQSEDIASNIRKLEDARGAINAARNSAQKVAPITALPAEILAHIFYFVLPGESCAAQRNHRGKISKIKYPTHPDTLAHVCSFWRRVALSSPSLWTHIDIALDHSLNPGLFARAKVYAIRAGQLPLEIHISDPGSEREKTRDSAIREGKLKPGQPGYDSFHDWNDLHDFRFLASDTASIQTLEIDMYTHNRLREIYFSVIEYFSACSKPGVLSQYVVRCGNLNWLNLSGVFTEPAETPYSLDGALLSVPNDHLEELWRQIPIMRIGGLCPHWKSKAYQGLVELCIDEGVPAISELQLVTILRSNPKLRIFRLTAPLETLIDSDIINPVYLEDLEDLNVMIRDEDAELYASRILRQIAPGSKPIQLSLTHFSEVSVVDFFSRANVTRLYIWCSPRMSFLFDQCRHLEILVLSELELDTGDLDTLVRRASDSGVGDTVNSEGEAERVFEPVSASASRIDRLYLLGYCEFSFEEIRAVVEGYSVQKLFIYDGQLSYPTGEGRTVCENSRNIKAKLTTIPSRPTIEYYPEGCWDGLHDDGCFRDPESWIRTSLRC
ncbi:unnamed protein product [Rhizoctonia solani]|uniref:F-box domain-containing protein n=1 Tax=Rhizoctonia solani TaxID=456999 RepID=A0A8H3I065_9AGAM|nr:unnamed protein product [Rhizoctonia solani]